MTGNSWRLQRAGRAGHLNKPQVSETCRRQGQDLGVREPAGVPQLLWVLSS